MSFNTTHFHIILCYKGNTGRFGARISNEFSTNIEIKVMKNTKKPDRNYSANGMELTRKLVDIKPRPNIFQHIKRLTGKKQIPQLRSYQQLRKNL